MADDDLRGTLETAVGDSIPDDSFVPDSSVESPDDSPGESLDSSDSSDSSVEPKESNIEEIAGSGKDKKEADAAKPLPDKDKKEADPDKESKEVRARTDRAPQSWKGDSKKLWETLPLPVRQEVARREREIQTKLQETAQDRAKVAEVSQVLAPHMERINRHYGGNPMAAVDSLLRAEHLLTVAPAKDRAQFIANMIKQFEVDVTTLDSILAGQPIPQRAQEQSNLDQLLQQRLAPIEQFLQRQRENEEAQRNRVQQEAAHTVETMAVDAQNYPYFDEVREEMADLIELFAKRGVALSLEDAYTRTVRMNDDLYNASSVRDSSQSATQAALDAHRAAQAAKGASVSVGGSPTGTGRNAGNSSDLRGIIESAVNNSGGRV